MTTKMQSRAANFRRRLKAHGLSHPQVAEMMGVDRVTVWRWANGHTPISNRTYKHIEAIWPDL